MTREELKNAIKLAKGHLTVAEAALAEFEAKAENNVFESLDKATYQVEAMLERRAFNDCEGAGNRGADSYTQEFMVGDARFIGTLSVEYNRYDKTYYYIDHSDFTYVPA